jgi:FAD/FMN-containing dehydrogenase
VRPSSEQAYAELNEHEEVNKIVYGSLKNYGGSVSAEHGIGLEKMAWLNINRSHTELNLMRSIKLALDPKNLLNPGKVFSLADL